MVGTSRYSSKSRLVGGEDSFVIGGVPREEGPIVDAALTSRDMEGATVDEDAMAPVVAVATAAVAALFVLLLAVVDFGLNVGFLLGMAAAEPVYG